MKKRTEGYMPGVGQFKKIDGDWVCVEEHNPHRIRDEHGRIVGIGTMWTPCGVLLDRHAPRPYMICIADFGDGDCAAFYDEQNCWWEIVISDGYYIPGEPGRPMRFRRDEQPERWQLIPGMGQLAGEEA